MRLRGLKISFVLVGALALPSAARAQTWTYVQESVITYCANNTSSCGNFAGTMIPPLPNSVWIFGVSTTNDVTATVSGGGAVWSECASCTTYLAGSRRVRMFYAFGGTAGATNFNISLSGNSGASFSVTFLEVLPPAGSTASFDVGGATSSSTCTGTCAGVPLTLSATDAVVELLDRTAPADWKGWPAPYQTLPNGDGVHLNAPAGSEAAPSVNVRPGSTGAVFSAIALKSSLGSFAPPAPGPLSLVSFVDPDPANGLNGLNCNPTCNLGVPSIGSGHLLYLEAANIVGTYLQSVSGGGTWVVPASCQIKGGQAPNNALSCAYVLSSSPGAASVAITMTGNANTQFAFYEVSTASGSFAFDAAAATANAASLNPSGASLSPSPGATDAVFQSIFVYGGTSSVSYFPDVRGCGSGCGPQFWNGQAASDAILNVDSSSLRTPQFTNQQNNATVVTGVAFAVGTPDGGSADAGVRADSGIAVDSGVAVDSGLASDAGAGQGPGDAGGGCCGSGGDGGIGGASGGCGCGSSTPQSSVPPLLLLSLCLLARQRRPRR